MIPDRHGRTDERTDGRLTVASPRSALASRGNKSLFVTSESRDLDFRFTLLYPVWRV